MGYHIILKHNEKGIEHHYVEKLNQLANYQLKSDSIIYQGEPSWKPILIQDSEDYKSYTYDWHRAGIKAQEIFKKQALKEEYILEELNQDVESFKNYTGIKKEYLKIKRGDFLIRNANNIEVDVKCRSFYTPKGKDYNCFDFNAEHLERHLNMQSFTQTPIVIALYQRVSNTDEVKSKSLRMIEVEHIEKIVKKLNLKKVKKENEKGEKYFVYQLPIQNTMQGFALIDVIKKRNKS